MGKSKDISKGKGLREQIEEAGNERYYRITSNEDLIELLKIAEKSYEKSNNTRKQRSKNKS